MQSSAQEHHGTGATLWGNSVLYFHGVQGGAMRSLLYQGQTIFRLECLEDFSEVANKFSLTGVNLSNPTKSTIKEEHQEKSVDHVMKESSSKSK